MGGVAAWVGLVLWSLGAFAGATAFMVPQAPVLRAVGRPVGMIGRRYPAGRPAACAGARPLRAAPGPGGEAGASKETKLLLSLLVDLVGMSTYALPGVGEAGDIAWAPISAILVQYLYGNAALSGLALVEELLPGLDFIPTATIAWFITYGTVSERQPEAREPQVERPEPFVPRAEQADKVDSRDGLGEAGPGAVVDVDVVPQEETQRRKKQ
uniref:Uncharacterized protein n=1 Tax=Rhizochromulina marina TaxID=1034831 RepID=A0A7S2RIK8_9STRA